MAENALPAPTPAPTPAPPAPTPPAPTPGPEPKPADTTPQGTPLTMDAFSDDEKKYLQSQGINDFSSPEAIKKMVNHARTAQQTASEAKAQLDKIKEQFAPAAPANPFNPTPTPGQPQPGNTPEPAQGLDPVTSFNLAASLAGAFPELKGDLTSGKFYQDMQAQGIPLMVNNQVNMQGITTFGSFAQKQAQLEAKMEEMNKPGEGAIPDANPTAPQPPADDAPMDAKMAYAIMAHVAGGNTHPRGDEATQFIQKKNLGS